MNRFVDLILGIRAVLLREMLLLKVKVGRLGYVFYSLMSPLIYLAAFGFGFGSRVRFDGVAYELFLIQGLICMTSMNNAYNLVMTSVSFGRLSSKSFQSLITAPVSPVAIMAGLVLSGMLRGFIAALVIVGAGTLLFGVFALSWLSVLALLLNLMFFASLGVVVGLMIRDMESSALIMNFFIMPMSFFSGTFFPIDNLPAVLRGIVTLFPLAHTNIIMRAPAVDGPVLVSVLVLLLATLMAGGAGVRAMSRYSE